MSKKNKLLGDHPKTGSIFSKWLASENDEKRDNLHRKLTELKLDDEIINQTADTEELKKSILQKAFEGEVVESG